MSIIYCWYDDCIYHKGEEPIEIDRVVCPVHTAKFIPIFTSQTETMSKKSGEKICMDEYGQFLYWADSCWRFYSLNESK